MFGEKILFGTNELKLDYKGRVYLPKYTRKEKDDELILKYDNEIKKYEIYSINEYDKIMSILENNILKSRNAKERLYYKKRVYEISKEVLKKITVDAHGRITIGDVIKDCDSVLCLGAHDHLIIEPIQKTIK